MQSTSTATPTRMRPQVLIPTAPRVPPLVSHFSARSYDSRGELGAVDSPSKGKGKAREAEESPTTREPWTLSLSAMERYVQTSGRDRVILLLGDPPVSALYPLLSSPSLAGALVLLASLSPAPGPTPILHPLPPSHPTIRTLKLDPKHARGAEAARIMQLLERGDRVAKAWRQVRSPVVPPATVTQVTKEMDELSELSSPGTPPTPEPSRPVSPSSSSFRSMFQRPGRTSTSSSPAPSTFTHPYVPQSRAFDMVVVFLPSVPASSGSASIPTTSAFELRAHATHTHLKFSILVSTVAAPFLIPRPPPLPPKLSRPNTLRRSGESLPASLNLGASSERKSGLSGILRPLRKLSVSSTSSARSSPPLRITTLSAPITTFPPELPLEPALLVHVLPPGLDKPTQAALARSLDGFLGSFDTEPKVSAEAKAIQTCLLPLGAFSDPVSLALPSDPTPARAFSPLEIILAHALSSPPSASQTRWLPSLHPPHTHLRPPTPLSALSALSSISTATTESSFQLSPSHPLSTFSIPIRSHVFHSRADEMGKHRPGHGDRKGVVLMGGELPTPPESEGSDEMDVEGEGTPTSGESVGTVRRRRWGRQY